MRVHAYSVAALCVISAGLTVSGCAVKNSPTSSGGVPAAATTAAAAGSATTDAPLAGGESGISGGSAGVCHPDNLRFTLGAKSGSNQVTQVVDMANTGASACTMDGFPGVDLDGLTSGRQNYTWSLVRSSARYSKVTLEPGASAHFDLVYLPDHAGGTADIDVVKFVVTPPNAFTQAEVTWSQTVLLQDGATHPGTYITPVVAGP